MAYPRKFQNMLLGKHKPLNMEMPDLAKSVKLLGLNIDHNLAFCTHASNI